MPLRLRRRAAFLEDWSEVFDRLVENIPAIGDPGYDEAIRNITNEVIGSDTMVTCLTATNIGNDVVRITTGHSIHKYGAGFGGSNALHGRTLALLGETVGTQLPMLVKFVSAPTENFAYALRMESVIVPSDAILDAYYALPTAEMLLTRPTVAQGGTNMNLSNFCPIPLARAPYFLDFKSPYKALRMGRELVATMADVGDRTRAGPLLDWLRASCVRLGANAAYHVRSVVNQNFEPTTPDARVVTCMQRRLAPYLLPSVVEPLGANPIMGTAAVLPAGVPASRTGEREYSILESSKIQAACGLTDAQWEPDLPELYTRMLEEGRTTADVVGRRTDTPEPATSPSRKSRWQTQIRIRFQPTTMEW
jgi:hypothetical protein